MKIKNSIKKLCKFCKLIIRKKKKYIYCNYNFKHKQRQF